MKVLAGKAFMELKAVQAYLIDSYNSGKNQGSRSLMINSFCPL